MPSVTLNWDLVLDVHEVDKHRAYLDTHGGIYLWLFMGKPTRIAYVGEAGNFTGRLLDHVTFLVSGRYTTFRVPSNADYIKVLKEKYMNRKLDVALKDLDIAYPAVAGPERFTFADVFFDPRKMDVAKDYLSKLKSAFASVPDRETRRDIEPIIMIELRKTYAAFLKEPVANIVAAGGRANCTPFGTITRYPRQGYDLTHAGKQLALIPAEVTSITSYSLPTTTTTTTTAAA